MWLLDFSGEIEWVNLKGRWPTGLPDADLQTLELPRACRHTGSGTPATAAGLCRWNPT